MRRIGRLRSEASPSNTPSIVMAADDAHHQPGARSRVAEIERVARREQRAEAGPGDAPASFAMPFDRRAERPAGLAGAQHVLALEQALDLGDARGSAARTGRRDARSTCRRAAATRPRKGPFRCALSEARSVERARSCELLGIFAAPAIGRARAAAAPNTLDERCRSGARSRIDMRGDAD